MITAFCTSAEWNHSTHIKPGCQQGDVAEKAPAAVALGETTRTTGKAGTIGP
jgi:hypothetical protein